MSTKKDSLPTVSATIRLLIFGRRLVNRIATVMMKELGTDISLNEKGEKVAMPSFNPRVHDGRLGCSW